MPYTLYIYPNIVINKNIFVLRIQFGLNGLCREFQDLPQRLIGMSDMNIFDNTCG